MQDTWRMKFTDTQRSVRTILIVSMSLAAALPVLGQVTSSFRAPQLTLGHWLLFFGVFIAFWIVFYFILYPYFLYFFDPGYSKILFWSLYLFYALTWIHLSLYLIFDIGFSYRWARWVAVVLTGLFLLWLVGVLVRGRRT